MSEAVVTRNGRITIAKEIRERLGIREGDVININMIGSAVLMSKTDAGMWGKIPSFLPEDFGKILKAIRMRSSERVKRSVGRG